MMITAECKKAKVDREVKTIVNADIISNLPESILHHIISLLPTTRCAVSTCILSKRWRYLWMSATKLAFSLVCKEQVYKSSFFIDQVLRRHSSNITFFYLHTDWSCYLSDASLVKSWLSAAVNRQVQRIVLRIRSASTISLPLSLCTSNMLTHLTIESPGDLELPSNIRLSSLKILHLINVNFPSQCDLSFNKLFSGLPNIHELKLDCKRWPVKNGTISLPTLRRLSLTILGYDKEDHFVKVSTENLIYLHCKSNLSVNISLANMSSLAEGSINICSYERMERNTDFSTNLFTGFCYTKSLQIDERSLEVLRSLNSQENLNCFPKFINLTALKINSRVSSYEAGPLIDVLQSAPILESVAIMEVHGGYWSRKPYPHCIECSLRNCSILRFHGRQADILFVKFLLKAARRLERLELCCTDRLCSQQKKLEEIMNKLKLFPRASNCCVIEFVTP